MEATVFYHVILEVTNHHFYRTVWSHGLARQRRHHAGVNKHQGAELRGGGILEAGYHTQSDPVSAPKEHLLSGKSRYIQPQKEEICTIWKTRPKE